MKHVLSLAIVMVLIVCVSSCILKPEYVCTCRANGTTKDYDLGKMVHNTSNDNAANAHCSNIQTQNAPDTCYSHMLN